MSKANHLYTNFTGGEVSPKLAGRPDYSKYQNSCDTLENFKIDPLGAATRRPGTEFIAEVKDSATYTRMVPFVYSDQQAYVMEFGVLYVRFYTVGGQLTSGGAAYEIASPYAASDLDGIQFTPSFDVIYLTHKDYPPYKLSRLGATSWTLEEIDFVDGPYREINDDQSLYLQASGKTGDITLTMSSMSVPDIEGTWDDTQTGSSHSISVSSPVLVVKFQATGTGAMLGAAVDVLQECELAGVTLACSIYHDSTGSIGSLVADADNECIVDTAGRKDFYFTATVTDGSYYWLAFSVVWPSGASSETIEITLVDSNSDYTAYYGSDTSSIAALSNSIRVSIALQVISSGAGFVSDHVGALFRIRSPGKYERICFSSSTGSGSGSGLPTIPLVPWAFPDEDFVAGATSGGPTTIPFDIYGRFTVDLSPYQATASDDPWSGRVVLEKSFDGVHYLEVASFFYSTKQEFFETKPGVYYRLRLSDYTSGVAWVTIEQNEQWGVVEITGYTSASVVSATVIIPLGSTDPTAEWREGCWSPYRGYPACSVFLEDRLWFGGTLSQPNTVWASWTGDYENFAPEGATDDAAISVTMLSREAEAIQWMIPFRSGLGIGTMSGEWLLSSGADGKPITAKTVNAQQHSTNGSAKDIMPVRVGSAILFAHRNRREIREMNYSFDSDSLDSVNLNQLADHILSSGVNGIAFQQKPHPTLWCWRDDGEVACLVYHRKEEVVGWYRVVTDGLVESIACIPSSLGMVDGYDEVWAVVSRTIGPVTKRYVERFRHLTDETAVDDSWYLDSALEYDSTAATTISGLDHLAGETVSVLGDGMVLTDKVVSTSGSITLERACAHVIAGLPFTSTLKTLQLDLPMQGGTIQGLVKRINRVILRLFRSLGGKCGPSLIKLDVIPQRSPGMTMGDPVPLITDDVQISFPSDPNWKDNHIVIVQDQPLPLTVCAIISRVEVYE